ncbi:class F sortase [Streptomyces sp. TRM66268-LWL]|uniref:Class F sortase n=1 Tax=Streptomyces polyasparticus TaxID=2767826 RepID=A0ABR7SLY7_9ACTN|nr:class F sortase [Streptomyces polyasparticus]MBC9716452.1 class F sortase [Streptomyces polyasparticus]
MAEIRTRRTRAATFAVVAALSVAAAAGCSAGAKDSADSAQNAAHVTPASVLQPSVPDHIAIPSIKVDANLDTVGLDNSGAMQTPPFDKPMEASWYKDGPTPGEKGAAAIAGHMDTPQVEKAVFYNLKELKKNAEIDIRREDGTTAVFKVDDVETYKKADFPTQKVYGKTDKAELRLITCGGDLTKDRHWDSNVVVFAHLTGEETA